MLHISIWNNWLFDKYQQPSRGSTLSVSSSLAIISPGTIEIRNQDSQKQDVSQISTDTAFSENALKDKFDAQKAECTMSLQREVVVLGQQVVQQTFDYLKLQANSISLAA